MGSERLAPPEHRKEDDSIRYFFFYHTDSWIIPDTSQHFLYPPARHSPPSPSRFERASLERVHQLVMPLHEEVGGLRHSLARPRLYSSDKMCVSSCATFLSWRDSGLRMSCRCVDKGLTSWREVNRLTCTYLFPSIHRPYTFTHSIVLYASASHLPHHTA
jgi:hypothetical protein